MKLKIMILLFLLIFSGRAISAQAFYKTTDLRTSFFSSAPIEDIQAISEEGVSVFNAETGEVAFRINIRSFEFPVGLMQEHFNENFMESGTFPEATFKGEIKDYPGLPQDGQYKITLKGVLDIHGVDRKREVPARLTVNGDHIRIESVFNVACEDHSIEIPKILWNNVAEVVEVEVNANYTKLDQ